MVDTRGVTTDVGSDVGVVVVGADATVGREVIGGVVVGGEDSDAGVTTDVGSGVVGISVGLNVIVGGDVGLSVGGDVVGDSDGADDSDGLFVGATDIEGLSVGETDGVFVGF